MPSDALSLKLSRMRFMRKLAFKSVIRDLDDAQVLYSYQCDPFRPVHIKFPRYGVSGYTIHDQLVNNWFKGDRKSAEWFLSWMFYKTIARKLCKKALHLTVILVSLAFVLNYVFFTNSHIFFKIGASLFSFLTIFFYYNFTNTPTRIFKESIKNFDSGFFNNKNKEIFFEKFFLDLPAQCVTLEDFIRLSGLTKKSNIDSLEALHEEWFQSSRELIDCIKVLEK